MTDAPAPLATTPYDHIIANLIGVVGAYLVGHGVVNGSVESQALPYVIGLVSVAWTALNLSSKIPSPIAALIRAAFTPRTQGT